MQEMLVRGLPNPRTEHNWVSRMLRREAEMMQAREEGELPGFHLSLCQSFSIAAVESNEEPSVERAGPVRLLAIEYRPPLALEFKPDEPVRPAKLHLTGLRPVVITSACNRKHRQGQEEAVNVRLVAEEVRVLESHLKVEREWYEAKEVLYVTYCFDYFNRGKCSRPECRHIHDTEQRAEAFFAGELGVSVELRKDLRRLLHLTAVKRKAAAGGKQSSSGK